jgi:hypothetical protein
MPLSRSVRLLPPRLKPVVACTSASSSQTISTAALPPRARRKVGALRNCACANNRKGKNRRSASTSVQALAGSTASGAEISSGSQ